MGLRRKAREIAMKSLYSIEVTEGNLELNQNIYKEKLEEIIENAEVTHEKIIDYARFLVDNTSMNLDFIDKIIEKFSRNWSLASIAPIEKTLMRIAIYEMEFTNTPHPIIINEAIEITKKYCDKKAGKFVNGILDSASRYLKNEKN